MKSICIVAHFAYGAMTGGQSGHAGGVERQTSMTARWLAERGYRVSLLTWDEGQEEDILVDGVRVIKMCRRDSGLPGIRFFYPRWSSLIRAMHKTDADCYYQNCAEYVTGQVALWCRLKRRRFIYSSANTVDCDLRLPTMRTLRERILYRYGLRQADRIIVQTKTQQQMLETGFGLQSIVLPMPCEDPGKNFRASRPSQKHPPRVVWVGRINRVKRLELLIEVASDLPDIHFDVAGKPDGEDSYSQEVLTRARALPNVTIHGMVRRDRLPHLYKNASLLCCTSLYEGFPNTFLEAWSHGLPVVSTYDPDDLISAHKLGIAAADKHGLVSGIKALMESPDLWPMISENARRYFSSNHALDPVMIRFEKVFLDLLNTVPDFQNP
ncbi:MAG: glycosyltransferase family 4 protein [Nitrospirae bacterium]|nr:glycosyltransferase family 4 protein [Nitrospirota bacterium]